MFMEVMKYNIVKFREYLKICIWCENLKIMNEWGWGGGGGEEEWWLVG